MGTGIKTNLIFFEKTGSTKEIWYGEVIGKFTKKKIVQDSNFEEVLKKWEKREASESSWVISIGELKKRGFDLSPKNPAIQAVVSLPEPKEIIIKIKQTQKEVDSIIDNIERTV